jgi:Methyltransferase domain
MEISGKRNGSRKPAKCYGWRPAQDVAADYLKLIPELGLETKLWPWAERYARNHAGRVLWDVDFLTSNYQFSRCLNIGGAPFVFEYLMKKAHPEVQVVSVDLYPDRFSHVERVLEIKVAQLDIERPCAAAAEMVGRFQCVAFCEIFEHLRVDLLKTMSFIRSLLSDDGFMYLTMPNGLGIAALHRILRGGRAGPDPVKEWSKLSNLGHMGHIREYSYIELREVLAHCGFEVQRHLYRRKISRSDGLANSLRERSQQMLTRFIPKLGDEIVVIARAARRD